MRTRGFASPDYSDFAIIGLVELKELDIQVCERNVELKANPVNDSNNAADLAFKLSGKLDKHSY
jgi:hypothetical protein